MQRTGKVKCAGIGSEAPKEQGVALGLCFQLAGLGDGYVIHAHQFTIPLRVNFCSGCFTFVVSGQGCGSSVWLWATGIFDVGLGGMNGNGFVTCGERAAAEQQVGRE